MTDNFNFLGLPSVVQELITNEIVHNSIPEDRIQLAMTSKYCNELVQRSRPKKIIDQFMIGITPPFSFTANSEYYIRTKEQLMEILPNCQIKQLQLENQSVFSEDYSEILDVLSEAARFATKFDIIPINPVYMDEIVKFYVKLKHLKSVTVGHPALILPYYPSKVKLIGNGNPPGKFVEDLARKSQNCPLAFLELKCSLSLDKCQQFLQTAKFSTGAEIRIRNGNADFSAYLTYLGQSTFTLENFSMSSVPIFINQKFVGKNKRIKLKTTYSRSDIAYNVISASNYKNSYCGVFKKFEDKMVIILNRDEILKVKGHATKKSSRSIYSAAMLESAFPTDNFTKPEERVKKINNVLGTNIQLIQADNFVQTVKDSRRGLKRRRI